MKKIEEKTWLWVLGAVFIFLIIVGLLYPVLENIENSKPSKNVTIKKSKSSFDFKNLFDFSKYGNLNLGDLCADLEDCIKICSEDIDRCETYCDENPENELCSKVSGFVSSEAVQTYVDENNISSPEDVNLEDLPEDLPPMPES